MTTTETTDPAQGDTVTENSAHEDGSRGAESQRTDPQGTGSPRTEDFTVRLEQVFQGPLDLLLHLVKEQEVEIQDVRLADVAQAYMDHVRALEGLDIEVAGEYLVIAATLMAIKSRSLLPREEIELEDDLDPQDELIQRLIEYRRFKGASDDLEDRFHRRSLEHPRGYRREVTDNEPERSYDLGEVTAWDLLATFSRLMRETLAGRPHTIKGDPRPLRWYVQSIGAAVRQRPGGASLRDLVEALADVPTREGLVGAFCALLELMKIGLVSAQQDDQADDITLTWSAPEEGEGDLDELIKASRFMDEESEELDQALESAETGASEPGTDELAGADPGEADAPGDPAAEALTAETADEPSGHAEAGPEEPRSAGAPPADD